ncbi:MAG: efflux RND transporter periplasmic adaptor subunit [Victivallales bacterium]|nr:efflux RND transporter periplasmic adaptor subunit [Victivallales bacterium]MCF7888986.1 efflux RND transporter periplasmic adaptor subunit [Victivallales bacterium]
MNISFRAFKCLTFFTAITLLISGCGKEGVKELPPANVIVTKVIGRKIKNQETVIGEVKALDKVNLRARVKGFLEKINFKEGSFVKKGELLFQIEKDQYKADVQSAKAAIINAKSILKNRTIDYERQKFLSNKKAVSEKEYDRAEAYKQQAEAQLIDAKAKLKLAELNLSYTDIYAPFDGIIGMKGYSIGNLVGSESDPLAVIVKADPVGVEFNLDEGLVVSIKQYILKNNKKSKKFSRDIGAKYVDINLVLSNNTEYNRPGKIDFVNNTIDPMTGTLLIRAVFDNPETVLLPGAYVNVKISSKFKQYHLLVPQAAIQEDQTGKFVMVVNDKNIVEKRNFETGFIYGTYIVASKGLKKGEKVIVEGLQKVREGLEVRTTERPPTLVEKDKKDSSAEKENKTEHADKIKEQEKKTLKREKSETKATKKPNKSAAKINTEEKSTTVGKDNNENNEGK